MHHQPVASTVPAWRIVLPLWILSSSYLKKYEFSLLHCTGWNVCSTKRGHHGIGSMWTDTFFAKIYANNDFHISAHDLDLKTALPVTPYGSNLLWQFESCTVFHFPVSGRHRTGRQMDGQIFSLTWDSCPIGMWRSSNSNSTTFELRTFLADSKFVECFNTFLSNANSWKISFCHIKWLTLCVKCEL